MINVKFFIDHSGQPTGFTVSGHAGYADFGKDIVCASVSSAVMLTVNTALQNFNVDATVDVGDNVISCKFKESSSDGAKLLLGLKAHFEALSEDYPKSIKVNISEV